MKLSVPLAVAALALAANAAWTTPKFALNAASGWTAHGFAAGLTSPRGVIFDKLGHLLVVQQGVGIVAFTLNSDGSAASQKTLLSYSFLNHGIALSADETVLFASSSNTTWKWTYDSAALSLKDEKKVVTGMVNADHTSRTLFVSKKHPNLLVVSRGSGDNVDLGADLGSGRAQVRVFDWTNLPAGDVGNSFTKGATLAYGVRNEVGIAEDASGQIWGVENSADDLVRVRQGVSYDVHQNNPGEKLHNLGDAAAASSKFYGYPNCFSVWDPSLFPSSDSFSVGDWFVQRPNSTGIDSAWCNKNAIKPQLTFQPHSAPLDIKFSPSDSNAYVSFHGSWDRQPPTGYKVVVVPGSVSSAGAWTSRAGISSTTGYTDLLWNTDVTKCDSGCFRPVGLAWSAAGRLYVTSDVTGEIFVLQKN
ncbi:soluble quino protein glucose dehydrogenase [Favolaschia claudopus]|uniref:Soluble quino protein glucose dehydrogenase n=1 Tax=Favolaschia claudopus TaxID=2862362 RepID=A0AAW0ATE8_9AGAR